MNNLKNKNIFINFEIFRNNLSIKNILFFFGKRIIDLFTHMPIFFKQFEVTNELKVMHIGQEITLDVFVLKYQKNFIKKAPFKVICENKRKQIIEILFFNMKEFQIKNYLKIGMLYRISGKLIFSNNKFQIIHPTNILKEDEFLYFDSLEPQYNLSRKGINKKIFRRIIKNNIETLKSFKYPNEWIHNKYMKENWNSFKDSLLQIHFPKSEDETKRIEYNRERLAFDELLSSYLTFHSFKKKIRDTLKIKRISNFKLSAKLENSLPFELTVDQKKSLHEIKKDLSRDQQMYRLLQGDVGSGKTVVALLAIADVVNSGYQAVLMAPTEILAKQHYDYFKDVFSKYKLNVEIITGKTKDKEKIYQKLFRKEINILVGTHSVYNSSIKFNKLGLIVIDEQHKFGVKQRINLLEKSIGCHTLIMSATPIPRSLSFAMYGEITTSNIKTKPKERKDVVTSIISIDQIDNLLRGIERKLTKEEQIFWILPTIGNFDSDENTLITRYEYLKIRFKNKVAYIHGKMKKQDIESVMQNFKNKKIMLLVSTTVVEVGINIPDATLMIIENAERFGLSQLHQLRGRVTRGKLNSNCVLIHNKKLSETTKERLLILKNNNDGFEIAEKDLYLRGAGDFFGTNQSGLPTWKFFQPRLDHALLNCVKKNSELLLENYDCNKDKINFLKEIFYSERNFKNYFSV